MAPDNQLAPQQQAQIAGGKKKQTFGDKVEDFIQQMERTERQWSRINNPQAAANSVINNSNPVDNGNSVIKDDVRQERLERLREKQREAAELQADELAQSMNERSTKEGASKPAIQTRLDIFANSPLFQRYLTSVKLGRFHGKPYTVRHLVNAEQSERDKLFMPDGRKRRTYYEILDENSKNSRDFRKKFEQDTTEGDQVRRESQRLYRANVLRLRRLYEKIRLDKKALREFSDIIRDARGKQNDKVFWEKLSEQRHYYASNDSLSNTNGSRPSTRSTASGGAVA